MSITGRGYGVGSHADVQRRVYRAGGAAPSPPTRPMNSLLLATRRILGGVLFRSVAGRRITNGERRVYWRALQHQARTRAQRRASVPLSATRYFVHIPKTAGMSIHAFLGACEPGGPGAPEFFDRFFPRDLIADLESARRCTVFSGHFLGYLDPLLGRPSRKATVLRDPVERAISDYAHKRRATILRPIPVDWHRPLRELLDDPVAGGSLVNVQARWLASLADDPVWLGLPEIPTSMSDDALLDRARAGLARIEIVGLYDQLPEFLDRLAVAWGLRAPAQIPRTNIGHNRRDLEITDDERDRLRELNRVDYALYDEVAASLRASPPTAPEQHG
jgi:hypothetical protein